MSTAVQVDLLRLIGRDVQLRYVAGTCGGEYASPCPFCGGKDRLHVQPAEGRWRCRQCSGTDHWSDAAAYVMQRDNLRYPEAVARLEGVPIMPPYTPPARPQAPSMQGVAFHCHKTLLASPRPLGWLEARGIDRALCVKHNLGYVPPGEPLQMDGHSVAPGIVIPLYGIDRALYGLKIRRAVGLPKYLQVKGSQMPLYGVCDHHTTLVVVEGEFDAMLLAKHAGKLVDVATLGSAQTRLPDRWCAYLACYRHILVCYDADDAGQQSRAWQGMPKAVRASLPIGKDITEAWQQGVDIKAWAALQLEALQPEPPKPPTPPVLHVEPADALTPRQRATIATHEDELRLAVLFPWVDCDTPAIRWACGEGDGLHYTVVERTA